MITNDNSNIKKNIHIYYSYIIYSGKVTYAVKFFLKLS